MFQFLESPIIVTLIIMLYFLFFFILFLTKLPRTKGKPKINTPTPTKEVTKESPSKCTMFGFLEKLPKGDPIPDECMSCQKLVECLMQKRAFDWYTGQDSTQAK